MICLQCGYCCMNLFVTIVDNPELGIVEGNFHTYTEPERCKHLRGNKIGEYSCAIHNYPWYKDTPCYDYTQIETANRNCRTGEYQLKQGMCRF